MRVRVSPHGKLLLDFRYRKVRCREFTGFAATPANRRRVQKFADLVQAEIAHDILDYRKKFPSSPRLHLFCPEPEPAEEKMLGDYLLGWLDDRCPFRSDGTLVEDAEIHPTTWYHERNVVRNRLVPSLGDIPLRGLTKARVKEYRRWLVNEGGQRGRGLSTKTAYNVLGILRKALADAVEDDLLEVNPVPKQPRSVVRRARHRSTTDPLTAAEMARFLKTVPQRYRALYLLWFWTGMRSSEIVALRWEDIDWARDTILIRRGRTPRFGGVEAEPKTGAREVCLDRAPEVMDALREHQRRSMAQGRPRYVFSTSRGTPFSQEDLNRDVWHPTLRRIGLRPRGQYAIKDTYVTLAMSSGEDPGWLARQVGTSETILLRHYRGYRPSPQRQDGSLVAKELRAGSEGEMGTERAPKQEQSTLKARRNYGSRATPTGFEPVLPA